MIERSTVNSVTCERVYTMCLCILFSIAETRSAATNPKEFHAKFNGKLHANHETDEHRNGIGTG